MKILYTSRHPHHGPPREMEDTIEDFVAHRSNGPTGRALGKLVTLLWEKGIITSKEVYDTFSTAADTEYRGAKNP